MVLGMLLREQEERRLVFDFEASLPNDIDVPMDDGTDGGPKDFKRGTVVCRHWLRGLCMKGDNCEFLHQYDMSKMPECRWGMECQVPECPFRHVPDEERVECAFYRQGFCSHGPNCRYRHIKLAREECPETADFSLQSKVAEEENLKRRKQTPQNEFYKIAICKHWEKMGSCPFNEECHFAHGESELRPFPKSGEPPTGRSGNVPPPSSIPPPQAAALPPPPVVLPDENIFCKYFMLHSYSYLNLAVGVEHQQWSVPLEIRQALKLASETCDDVFFCVTVTASKHFQAIARLVRGTLLNVEATVTGEDLSTSIVPYDKDASMEPEAESESEGRSAWNGAFSVEWLHVCECPYERLAQFEKQSLAIQDTVNGQELETEVGHAIVRLLFHQPPIQLHLKSVEDEMALAGGAEQLAIRRREAAELSAASGTGASLWNVTMPGFVFACNNNTIDECFGRMIMGLAKDHEAVAMKNVVPGTPLFLINMSDRHVLGIFEAVTPPAMNMIPGAFSHGPNVPSPFPVQVRFHVALNAPATPDVDTQIQAIFGDRGIRIGPLSLPVTQRLADVFAERCGPHLFGPGGPPSMGMGMGMAEGRSGTSSNGGTGPFIEKMLVGIEVENEFGVTRRIIGPAGSHMKRISQEAGGGAKIKVRGRGSGSKESTEDEANEPLMIIVSAENERSFRIACELTVQLLNNIHHDHHVFLQRLQQRSRGGGVFTHPSIPSGSFHGGQVP